MTSEKQEKTVVFRQTRKGWRIKDKHTGKDLTGLAYRSKWEAAQYWHEIRHLTPEYRRTEL